MRRAGGTPLVLTLDVGTSSVRAMVFDSCAEPVPGAEAHLPYEAEIRRDGTAEVDADLMEALVAAAIDEALAGLGRRAAGLAAVGFSSFWHGLVGAGPRGGALTPLYLWSDGRSWRQAEELRRLLDEDAVRDRTGCPIHTTYWPARLAWLRASRPALWRRRPRWLGLPDLLQQRWFGNAATSLSLASGTGLLDRGGGWDVHLLDLLELGADSLPSIEAAATGLLPGRARRWPALAGIPWVTAGDGALANLGSGCIDFTQRALTVGTSGALRVMASRWPQRLPQGLWCYRLDHRRFLIGGALNSGGNLHAWLLRVLKLDLAGLEGEIGAMAPGAHGLTVLPLLAGERSLGFALHASGAISGLTLATTATDVVRAALEAVAVDFGRVDRRLDECSPAPRRLVASGGGLLASPAWMQMMADATRRTVAASAIREASSRGAAILALEHLGVNVPSAEAVGRSFRPRPAAAAALAAQARRQEALHRALLGNEALERPGPRSQGPPVQRTMGL